MVRIQLDADDIHLIFSAVEYYKACKMESNVYFSIENKHALSRLAEVFRALEVLELNQIEGEFYLQEEK